MEKLISRLSWLLKQKGRVNDVSNMFSIKDDQQFTQYLKSNPQFVQKAKDFHKWKESLLK